MKQPGDRIELGDTIGHPMEAFKRYARIVGIRKDDCRPIERFIFRLFRPDDDWFPTGEYRTSWLIVPYAEK